MIKRSTFVLGIICLIFLGIYFWLATPIKTNTEIGNRFDWPDEVANYFWSDQYAKTGSLFLAEPLNLIAKNQVHPRSFNVRPDGSLVPGSFLGLILLFGSIAKIFSSNILFYITPIFSILAVLGFYGIIKRIFGEKIALISAALMLVNPAWWYYSVTPMLPNVTFVSLIIMSIYFLIKDNKYRLVHFLAAAVLAGLAVSIRPSEIIWISFLFLATFIYIREKLKFTRILFFLILAAIVICPTLFWQQALYGSFLSSGYDQLDQVSPTSCQICQITGSLFLPFGFHPRLIAVNFWTHYLSRLWWLSLIAALGVVAFFTQKSRPRVEIFGYIAVSLFIFFWLVVYYGSWQFDDLLTVHLNTLGLSYVRYWLPLYLLSLPFMAIGLLWLSSMFKNRVQNFVIVILLCALIYPSADLVLRSKPDSILPVRSRIKAYREISYQINQLTEEDSVIVTVRKDKLFFPDRKVIHTFDALSLNKEILDILVDLTPITPVYYYALGPEPVVEFDNGLKLEKIANFDQEILYQVK